MSSQPFERRSFAGGATLSRLTGALTSGDLSISLDASTGWPDGSAGPWYATLARGASNEECVRITSRVGLVLTLSDRGADGTVAQSHAAGETVEVTTTAIDDDEANQTAVATIGAVQAKGDQLVGTAAFTFARVPIGSDDTFWLADSAQTAGAKWGQIPTGALSASSMFAAGVVDATALGAASVGATALVDGAIANGTKLATGFRLYYVGAAASPPASPAAGDLWEQSDTKRVVQYVGGAWKIIGDSGPYTAYTPTWTAASGTPTIGNGSITGRYKELNGHLHVKVQLATGSTSNVAGTVSWGVSLPGGYTADTTFAGMSIAGGGLCQDGSSNRYRTEARMGDGTTMQFVASDNTALVDGTHPFAWGAGCALRFAAVIELA